MDDFPANGARERAEPRPTTPSYRFALRPKWLASHVLVVVLAVLFVNLGFWQLRRLDERKEFNALVETNAQTEPEALPADVTAADLDDLEWRRVVVEGSYLPDSDVLVANRALNEQPGFWVVSPLGREGGAPAVAVVRGFVTRAVIGEGDLSGLEAPSGPVRVTGYVQRSRSGGRFATGLPADALPEITRPDIGALGERWGTAVAPLWIQLAAEGPNASSPALTPVPLPELSDGPHLSYAVQWFIFATIAVVGYGLVLRRNARVTAMTRG